MYVYITNIQYIYASHIDMYNGEKNNNNNTKCSS